MMRTLASHASTASIRVYCFALMCTAIAFGARLLLSPLLNEHSPLLLFALAVAASAIRGGFGPGICCTILSALASVYFMPTANSLQAASHYQWVSAFQILVFMAVGIILSWMGGEVRNSRLSAIALASERNQILESIPDGFIAVGKGWRVAYVSKAAGELLRISRRHLVGQALWNGITEWRGTLVESKLRQAFEKTVPVRFDYWSEESKSWFLFHVEPQDETGLTVYFSDITERKIAEIHLRQALSERDAALRKVQVLSGFLPICASCKKIRDEVGDWHQMEQYVGEHSEAQFSHTMCPECSRRYYGDLE